MIASLKTMDQFWTDGMNSLPEKVDVLDFDILSVKQVLVGFNNCFSAALSLFRPPKCRNSNEIDKKCQTVVLRIHNHLSQITT